MRTVLSPACDADFAHANGELRNTVRHVERPDAHPSRPAGAAVAAWATVLGVVVLSFALHLQPGANAGAERAAEGMLAIGAAAALVQAAGKTEPRGSNPAGPATGPVAAVAMPAL